MKLMKTLLVCSAVLSFSLLSSCNGVKHPFGWQYSTRGEQAMDEKMDEMLERISILNSKVDLLSIKLRSMQETKKEKEVK